MSDLVGNPEDRFSRVAAQMMPINVLVPILITSFVTTAPHLRGRVGDSRAKVRGNYFSSVPAVQGK